MNNKEIYKIWAPTNKKWVDWVRPVPFIMMKKNVFNEARTFNASTIEYVRELLSDTAIIVDLPDVKSVEEGIGLAKIGYRPIPIYNGVDEQKNSIATTDNHSIEPALIWGAIELQNIEIKDDASPVFLLDSNRMNRFKMDASIFDNSWDIYHQDMPSYKYFKNNGIKNIIIVGDKFNKDLQIILYKFQKQNIKIYYTNRYDKPKVYKIKNPRASVI